MAEHPLGQEHVSVLADTSGESPAGKKPLIANDFSDTADADNSLDGTALCNSAPASLSFGPRSGAAIPFTSVALLQPFTDGLRRPPRAKPHLA